MKATFKLMAGALLLLAACQSKNSQLLKFIPGTYTNSAKGEFGVAYDTLAIRQVDGNNYQIIRKTTYQAVRNGNLLPKHRRVQILNTVWDRNKQELDETVAGRIFRFDADKKLLLINQASYRKIN